MHSFLVKGVRQSPFWSAIPAALGALLLAAAPVSAVPIYSITDLGTSGIAYGINNAGHVVGDGFFYDGTMTGINIGARAVNDAGLVAGAAHGTAVIYDFNTGTATDRGMSGSSFSGFDGINNTGKIVGTVGFPSGQVRAFVYDIPSDTVRVLGTLGGSTSAGYDINDAGWVTGESWVGSTSLSVRAFLYDPTTGTMKDLGTLGGTRSWGRAINNVGQVAGQAEVLDRGIHAFLYDIASETMTDLGTLGGSTEVWGINDAGQVVGKSTDRRGQARAFIWDDGTMYDLNDLIDPDDLLAGSVVLTEARDINERGDIAANGCYTAGPLSGQCRAFLLTALDIEFVRSIPEPGSLALLGSALLGIPFVRRLKAVRH